MGALNQTKLDDIHAEYLVMFDELYGPNMPAAVLDAYVTQMPVNGTSLEMDWVSALPVPREWVGELNVSPYRGNAARTRVQAWEKTIGIDIVELELDKGDVIGRALSNFLADNISFKDRLMWTRLVNGFTYDGTHPTFDGVAFFSTAHPNGPSAGTQSNTTTSALTYGTFTTARTTMKSLQDENGEPFFIEPNVLMVGPKLESVARQLLTLELRTQPVDSSGGLDTTSSVVAAGTPNNVNKLYNIEVVVHPRLVGTYDDYWFLMDTTKSARPLVLGVGRDLTPRDNLSMLMTQPTAIFSIQALLATAYGHWSCAYGANVA